MAAGSRRRFLAGLGALAAGTLTPLGVRLAAADATPAPHAVAGFGPLESDPDGLLDLPAGFRYRIISRVGDPMDDGLVTPGLPDGMHAFPGGGSKVVLVRNHELEPHHRETAFRVMSEPLSDEQLSRIYDSGVGRGGVTTLVYDVASGRVEKQCLTLAGTLRNCSGGATPWGSWISCEEIVINAGQYGALRDHGYNFEVVASARALVEPAPLEAMGRFYHEAVAVDAATGIVYQTEDLDDGLLYRFVPREPGRLAAGGRLQALVVDDLPGVHTGNREHAAQQIPIGQRFSVRWLDLEDVASPNDDLRYQGRSKGAAAFSQGEGMAIEHGAALGETRVWFVCTTGGRRALGQLWCYRPGPEEGTSGEGRRPGSLELALEPNNIDLLHHGDNITVTPFDDLLVCEDNPSAQHLVGITPAGGVYRLAANARRDSEFAGATFSPDASTLFVNIQHAGLTVAINGPWHRRKS